MFRTAGATPPAASAADGLTETSSGRSAAPRQRPVAPSSRAIRAARSPSQASVSTKPGGTGRPARAASARRHAFSPCNALVGAGPSSPIQPVFSGPRMGECDMQRLCGAQGISRRGWAARQSDRLRYARCRSAAHPPSKPAPLPTQPTRSGTGEHRAGCVDAHGPVRPLARHLKSASTPSHVRANDIEQPN